MPAVRRVWTVLSSAYRGVRDQPWSLLFHFLEALEELWWRLRGVSDPWKPEACGRAVWASLALKSRVSLQR